MGGCNPNHLLLHTRIQQANPPQIADMGAMNVRTWQSVAPRAGGNECAWPTAGGRVAQAPPLKCDTSCRMFGWCAPSETAGERESERGRDRSENSL